MATLLPDHGAVLSRLLRRAWGSGWASPRCLARGLADQKKLHDDDVLSTSERSLKALWVTLDALNLKACATNNRA
jgi:hypothetical protein